jgi:S1-C subfamily serine protease
MIGLPRHRRERATPDESRSATPTPVRLAGVAVALGVTSAMLLAGCGADPPAAAVGLAVTGCPPQVAHGSGVLIAPGLVLTSAHVVRGAEEITITSGRRSTLGTVVAFDPEMDLAYVEPDQPLGRGLRFGAHVERGEAGRAYVWRDEAIAVIDVVVRRPITINTEDIYIDGETSRPGWELEADIRPGDSGGAVMVGGRVIGVLWARSSRSEGRAYAIDPVAAGALVRSQLLAGSIDATTSGDPIDLTRCN